MFTDDAGNPVLFPPPSGTLAPVVEQSRASARTVLANRLFAEALVEHCGPAGELELNTKPFDLRLPLPLPPLVRVYMFTMTTHPSERQEGAYRIQVILPNRSRHFDATGDPFVILAGYEPNLGIFALWDAAAHDVGSGIPHSKGVQIREDTLLTALSNGLATQTRSLRGSGEPETIVACRQDAVPEALGLRWELSVERLLA